MEKDFDSVKVENFVFFDCVFGDFKQHIIIYKISITVLANLI